LAALVEAAMTRPSPSATRASRKPVSAEERLRQLAFTLPPPVDPEKLDAAFVPVLVVGDMAYVSGHVSSHSGEGKQIKGKLGKDLTEEEGYKAAELCALGCLASLRDKIGSLDKVEQIVRVIGFVNSDPAFERQPWVVNGASHLLVKVFGDKGKHSRCAIGVAALPLNFAVEVEMLVRIRT